MKNLVPIVRLVTLAALLAAAFASAQAPAVRPSLIPCSTSLASQPCSEVATSPAHLVGVWKQFLGNPALQAPGGVGYIRYFPDGRFHVADTPENTLRPYRNYPTGRVTFEGEVMTIRLDVPTPLAECNRPAAYQVQVLRYGHEPVALVYKPVDDECLGRLADLEHPLILVDGTERAWMGPVRP